MKFVIDSHYLGYKAYHTETNNLSYNGMPTGVLFGFIKQIFKLAEDYKTKDFIFCFDSSKSYRELIYPGYKLKRKQSYAAMNPDDKKQLDDVRHQFNELYECFLPSMGFKNLFKQNGYEADDLIANVVQRFPDDYLIVSSDHDLYQLLVDGNRGVRIRVLNNDGVFDAGMFKKKFRGIEPFDWMKVKAIAGCRTDDVEGVAGVAETTAIKYLLGQLKKDSVAATRISSEEGKVIYKRNLPLVSLPFAGIKPIRMDCLFDDELDYVKFRNTMERYGFRYLQMQEQVVKWRKNFKI